MSEETYSIDTVTKRIRERLSGQPRLDATFKFDLKGDGFIHINGKDTPVEVSNDDKPADCTIKIAITDLVGLSKGTLNPTTAFLTGRIKVTGNMSVAMKIGPALKG